MFNNAFFVPESRLKTSPWAFPLSFAVHAAAAAVLIVIPLLRPLPPPPFLISGAFLAPDRILPLPPPPPPPPARSSSSKRIARVSPAQLRPLFEGARMIAPVVIPTGIEEETIPGFGIDGGVEGGVEGGIKGGIYGSVVGPILEGVIGDVLAPLPAVGDVRPPRLLKKVDPLYPELARESRTEGDVIIEAETDIYGRVAGLRVLRSVPLLDEAAVEAVRQWIYEPMVVNGRPRGIVFSVCVRFVLR